MVSYCTGCNVLINCQIPCDLHNLPAGSAFRHFFVRKLHADRQSENLYQIFLCKKLAKVSGTKSVIILVHVNIADNGL